MKTVSVAALERAQVILGMSTQDMQPTKGQSLDVETYLKHYGHEIVKIKPNGNSTLYCLKECVFDSSHTSNESAIGVTLEGKLFYQCFHNSCNGLEWKEARERISGKDSLKPFMPNGNGQSSLSNSPYIYNKDNKDNRTIKEYQRSTTGGIAIPLDNTFDPFSILKKGSDLMNLDIKVEWVIDKLIPKQSITLLHGRGGIGKSWITLGITDSISKGLSFLGLATEKLPVVYIDYENPFPMVVERVKKVQASEVYFWHSTNEVKPPKLDTNDFELYKRLPPCVLVYDTLRASQAKDENDSRQMAFVMSRLKELRDMGFTILLLHHTPKGNDQTYKGSTAILDLADHVLSLHKVKKGNLEETDDEEAENVYYRFGTKHKTRYEPFHVFLELKKEYGFVLAQDPDTEELEEIYDLLKEASEQLKQSQVYDLVKAKLGITSKGKVIKLLNKGINKYWDTRRDEGKGRAVYYCPIVQPYICKDNKTVTKGQTENDRTAGHEGYSQTVDNSALSYCPDTIQTEKTESNIEDSAEFQEYLTHYTQQGLTLPEAKRLARLDYEADHGTWEH